MDATKKEVAPEGQTQGQKKIIVNIDTTQIDLAQEKANELENTLKRVKELINLLNSK